MPRFPHFPLARWRELTDTQASRRLFRQILRIRLIEERVAQIYPTDKIKSPVHLSIGQEVVSVAVCDVLAPQDVIAISYRGHAAYLAKGGDLPAMMAEMYGKPTGCAGGKGGSMHLISPEAGVMGASAVVGTHIPLAAGNALAAKLRGQDQVTVCFFGDGATEEGCFSETLNFAALHQLPILFVCENNGYAIHSPLRKRWANLDLCARVRAFGVPAVKIESSDVGTVRDTAEAAVAAIRAGQGPQFIEAITYRWLEHVGPSEDFNAGYRSRAEAEPWHAQDTVAQMADNSDADWLSQMRAEINAEIDAAVAFAEHSPAHRQEDLYRHVYAD